MLANIPILSVDRSNGHAAALPPVANRAGDGRSGRRRVERRVATAPDAPAAAPPKRKRAGAARKRRPPPVAASTARRSQGARSNGSAWRHSPSAVEPSASSATSTGRWRLRPSLRRRSASSASVRRACATRSCRGGAPADSLRLFGIASWSASRSSTTATGSAGRRDSTSSIYCYCSSFCAAVTARSARSAGSRWDRLARFSRRSLPNSCWQYRWRRCFVAAATTGCRTYGSRCSPSRFRRC